MPTLWQPYPFVNITIFLPYKKLPTDSVGRSKYFSDKGNLYVCEAGDVAVQERYFAFLQQSEFSVLVIHLRHRGIGHPCGTFHLLERNAAPIAYHSPQKAGVRAYEHRAPVVLLRYAFCGCNAALLQFADRFAARTA